MSHRGRGGQGQIKMGETVITPKELALKVAADSILQEIQRCGRLGSKIMTLHQSLDIIIMIQDI